MIRKLVMTVVRDDIDTTIWEKAGGGSNYYFMIISVIFRMWMIKKLCSVQI